MVLNWSGTNKLLEWTQSNNFGPGCRLRCLGLDIGPWVDLHAIVDRLMQTIPLSSPSSSLTWPYVINRGLGQRALFINYEHLHHLLSRPLRCMNVRFHPRVEETCLWL